MKKIQIPIGDEDIRMFRDLVNDGVPFTWTFDEIDVEVVEFSPEPGSRVTTSQLKDIKFPEDSIVGVINHHGQLSIARGESQLTDEDTVLVFAKSNVVSKLRKLFES